MSEQDDQSEDATALARVARLVQLELLPPSPMAIGDYRLEHRLLVGPGPGTDFVDYFVLAERYCCLVLISLPTAAPLSVLTAVLLKNSSRRLRREFRRSMLSDPREIVRWLVDELAAQGLATDFGVTLGVGLIDEAPMRFVRAGRLAPALLLDRGPLPGHVLAEPVVEPLERLPMDTLEITEGSALLLMSNGALSPGTALPEVTRWWDALQALPAPVSGPDATALLLRRP